MLTQARLPRAEPGQQLAGVDEEQADQGQHCGQAGAEGDDQEEPEADPIQGDGSEEDDESGGAGDEAVGQAEGDQALPGERRPVLIGSLV